MILLATVAAVTIVSTTALIVNSGGQFDSNWHNAPKVSVAFFY